MTEEHQQDLDTRVTEVLVEVAETREVLSTLEKRRDDTNQRRLLQRSYRIVAAVLFSLVTCWVVVLLVVWLAL